MHAYWLGVGEACAPDRHVWFTRMAETGYCHELSMEAEVQHIRFTLDEDDKALRGVALLLADIMMREATGRLLTRYLEGRYPAFEPEERRRMAEMAFSQLNVRSWHGHIAKAVYEALEQWGGFEVEGMMRFRLRDWTATWKEAMDQAAGEIVIEREYKDFIRLLTYFVEMQPPKTEEVHVLVEEGHYTLTDGQYQVLDNVSIPQSEQLDTDPDDMLISALITIAPNRVVFHGAERMQNTELMRTIDSVFGGRITLLPRLST